ncbi:MAG: GDP-mannose 4,6-dehydratase [Bacteroidota bacterium]
MKKLLITGGCGFLGSNLASEALRRGFEVVLFDDFSRVGSRDNFDWLSAQGPASVVVGNISNRSEIENVIISSQPDIVFHLAGQVAMTTSIVNPVLDFETNLLGTFNILESLRKNSPECMLVYSSTNKVYGDLEQYSYEETTTRYKCIDKPNGFDENIQLDFHSPYGVSKGAADQYVLDYARIYNMNTVVLRHSSMYGGRQFATIDQGWIGWFCQQAHEKLKDSSTEAFTIFGNGKQVRDLLHADDMKELYFSLIENITSVAGQAFNVGGGIENSLSLLELFEILEQHLNIKLSFNSAEPRISDQRVFVADITKAKRLLNWSPKVGAREGVIRMLNWVVNSSN